MKRICEIIDCDSDLEISGIKTDSRKVEPGDLFVAVKGFFVDHEEFIPDAISRGAVCVISESDLDLDVLSIKVDDVNKTLISVLKKYYDNVQDNFNYIGITGTDGKTSSATIISKILDCCYIGTNGVIYRDYKLDISNTTPEVCEMFYCLEKIKSWGCKTIVMEVSSEALLHERVDYLSFDIGAFTSISEDHLNIHKTLENYINSKKRLFSLVKNDGVSILNIDDSNYDNVKKSCVNSYSYGKNEEADFRIMNIELEKEGSSFDIVHNNDTYHISTNLPYLYNVYNVTLGFVVSYLYGISSDEIIRKISAIKSIDGRGEVLDFGQDYTIILDYAHTYKAIENIINNNLEFNYNRIIVVTGAAGGREKEKRSRIGKLILDKCDLCIFTMDDPRYESVDDIIDDMLKNTDKDNYLRIVDRKEAIFKALNIAKSNDLVLIIGKGRDNYMAIEDKKIPYNDYDVINEFFQLDK